MQGEEVGGGGLLVPKAGCIRPRPRHGDTSVAVVRKGTAGEV